MSWWIWLLLAVPIAIPLLITAGILMWGKWVVHEAYHQSDDPDGLS